MLPWLCLMRNNRFSAVVIMMILMIISDYQHELCGYTFGSLIERGADECVHQGNTAGVSGHPCLNFNVTEPVIGEVTLRQYFNTLYCFRRKLLFFICNCTNFRTICVHYSPFFFCRCTSLSVLSRVHFNVKLKKKSINNTAYFHLYFTIAFCATTAPHAMPNKHHPPSLLPRCGRNECIVEG